MRDGAIRTIYGSRSEQPKFDGATEQRDNARIAAFDKSMGWISYNPAGKKGSVGSGETVPATMISTGQPAAGRAHLLRNFSGPSCQRPSAPDVETTSVGLLVRDGLGFIGRGCRQH